MKHFLLLLNLMGCWVVFSQRDWSNQSISLSYGRGAIVPEYSSFLYSTQELEHLVAVDWNRRSHGKSEWEALFNYPELGFSLQYSTLGNDAVYGRELSLFPYTRLHFLHDRKWDLVYQVGFGLGYVSKKYDAIHNPDNVVIGSHLNFHFNSQFLVTVNPFPKWTLYTGIAFDHLSNANLEEPNIGINSAHWKVGTTYQFGKQAENIRYSEKHIFPAQKFCILPSFGGKHTRALASNFYFVASLTADYQFLVRKRFMLTAGPDFFFDSSVPTEMDGKEKVFKTSNYFQTGIHCSQLLRYKKAVFGIQTGIYIGLTDAVGHHPIYNRGIIEYHFTDHFYARLAMKSHLHILEFPEFGIGFKWKTYTP